MDLHSSSIRGRQKLNPSCQGWRDSQRPINKIVVSLQELLDFSPFPPQKEPLSRPEYEFVIKFMSSLSGESLRYLLTRALRTWQRQGLDLDSLTAEKFLHPQSGTSNIRVNIEKARINNAEQKLVTVKVCPLLSRQCHDTCCLASDEWNARQRKSLPICPHLRQNCSISYLDCPSITL